MAARRRPESIRYDTGDFAEEPTNKDDKGLKHHGGDLSGALDAYGGPSAREDRGEAAAGRHEAL